MIERIVWVQGHAVLARGDARIVRRTGWAQLITPNDPRSARNAVLHSVLSEVEVDATIDRTMKEYAEQGSAFCWIVSPLSGPVDLRERLVARGFRDDPVRYFGCRPAAVKPKVPKGVVVEPVDPDDPETLIGLVMSDPDHASPEMEADVRWAIAQPTYRFFVAAVDAGSDGSGGIPCGFAAYRRLGKAGWLFGGWVSPAFRGRGAYRGLVAARLDDMRSKNVSSAYVMAKALTAGPILERMGLENAGDGAVLVSGNRD